MDITSTERDRSARLMIGALSAAGAMALWVSQPPWCLWLIGFVAVIPWLAIVCQKTPLGRREYFLIWVAGFLYWAISLQGLRHAHPVMYACWLALAGYLAVYLALFVVVARRLIVKRIPLWIAAPVAWVASP